MSKQLNIFTEQQKKQYSEYWMKFYGPTLERIKREQKEEARKKAMHYQSISIKQFIK